jgi:hypothetical protein
MSKFREFLLKERQDAYLIKDNEQESKSKEDYIVDAQEGIIVAFRLNFESNAGVKLTKVISGKILENNKDDETYVIETRNGLKYGVPYAAVVWVKTGNRWPKGVYEEMKKGSVEVKEDEKDVQFEEASGDSTIDWS